MGRVLVVFLDGVGIGPPDPDVNPFLRANLPALSTALGGSLPTLDNPRIDAPHGKAFPIDACLGVAGVPQSGTGQVALLTGRNAPELLGRHFGPWSPVGLRPMLRDENFLSAAVAAGARTTFANAYPAGFPGDRSPRRVAAIPLAALAAGVLDRDHTSLAAGDAVASEISNDAWIQHGLGDVPSVTAERAGANLARLSSEVDLTLFAHYQTDSAGHRGGMAGAALALERVDAFFSGILGGIGPSALLLVVSDHGNIEDVRTGHTRNPALGLALGRIPSRFSPPERLTDVAELVLDQVLG